MRPGSQRRSWIHAYAFEHADRQDLFQEIVFQGSAPPGETGRVAA